MNVYEKIGLQRVINASGRMSALGVSTLSEEVAAAAIAGGSSYVVMEELMDKAGEIVSTFTKGEDSCITSCASAGIALSVAGIITKGKKSLVERMPDAHGLANEIILQKGHVVQFGAPIASMIRMGGGKPIEVGMANDVQAIDVEEAINENTAALLYVKSHHCVQKGMLNLQEYLRIAHQHHLPLIIDAAAEEDLQCYIAMGADLVIYSGAKAMEATTSGIITGKKELIAYVKAQSHGIGRPMKIGKEGIMGLLKAMELYANKDHQRDVAQQLATVHYLIEQLNRIKGLTAEQSQDEAGREIYRVKVSIDPAFPKTAVEIDQLLRAGNPSIHCRKHLLSQGILSFDPRPMVAGDQELIVQRMKELMEGFA